MNDQRNDNLKEGCFQTSRSIFNSEIFTEKPDKWFKIWTYLYGMANHKTNKDKDGYRRGERFMSYKEIMYMTGATKEQVYRCLAWLKDDMLTMHKTTRGFIYKVNKYDLYQNISNYKSNVDDSKDDSTDDSLTTGRRQIDDTINKNDKNENNVNNTNGEIQNIKYKNKKPKTINKNNYKHWKDDQGFVSFYKAYPKKRAPARAYKVWKKLTEADKKKAREALPKHKKQEQWKKENGAYIPHPATWLNDGAWEDEVKVKKTYGG